MSAADQPKWLAERINQTSDRTRVTTCPRCHSPVLQARAGHVAALDVTADPEPINPVEEIIARLEGRLTWHLVSTTYTPPRITWRHSLHIQAGPAKHPVLRDHRCPPQPTQGTLL
ncbi:hypothetical protein KVH27_19355 [Streptomyces olivaceus]|uniref:hypothetical protein n=1 Tax=Streptomyces olivaceus TaxID=47716 RepID=UPI001CCB6923|nr:hypothetical protein [Streptomyces olivaceus]MBZ6250525.1 hypothetical protein [Streptomyces olivaceus]